MKKPSLKQLQQQRTFPRMEGPALPQQDLVVAAINQQLGELRAAHKLGAVPASDVRHLPVDLQERAPRIQHNMRVMSDADLGAGARRAQVLVNDMLGESEHAAAKVVLTSLQMYTTTIAHVLSGDLQAGRTTIRSGLEGIETFLLKVMSVEIEKAKTDAEVWINTQRADLLAQAERAIREAEAELNAAIKELDTERELLTHAADQAAAEASAARRDAKQARHQLAEAEARHRENGQKNRDLAAEEVRRAKASEKEWRQLAEVRLLDKQNYAELVKQQAAEIEALQAQLTARSAADVQEPHTIRHEAEATTSTQEEEVMPITQLDTSVAAVSYCVWLRAAGHEAGVNDKERTVHCATATSALLEAWRTECPTAAAQAALVVRVGRGRRGSVAA